MTMIIDGTTEKKTCGAGVIEDMKSFGLHLDVQVMDKSLSWPLLCHITIKGPGDLHNAKLFRCTVLVCQNLLQPRFTWMS